MKRFILVTVLNCIYTFSIFSQQTIVVTPQEMVTLLQIKYDNLQIRDDPGQEGLKPYFENERVQGHHNSTTRVMVIPPQVFAF